MRNRPSKVVTSGLTSGLHAGRHFTLLLGTFVRADFHVVGSLSEAFGSLNMPSNLNELQYVNSSPALVYGYASIFGMNV